MLADMIVVSLHCHDKRCAQGASVSVPCGLVEKHTSPDMQAHLTKTHAQTKRKQACTHVAELVPLPLSQRVGQCPLRHPLLADAARRTCVSPRPRISLMRLEHAVEALVGLRGAVLLLNDAHVRDCCIA
jgi:hypothetical protein